MNHGTGGKNLNDVFMQKKQVNNEIAVNSYNQLLGLIFYPSSKAVKDGIEKSMA